MVTDTAPDTSRARALTGWGRTAPTVAHVHEPASVDDVVGVLRESPHRRRRGVLARGLGRSYGDAATAAGQDVLDTRRLTGWDLDETTGVAAVAAGTSLDVLLRDIVPRGWFVPVTPGTRYVSIGGAIAADVHGKNHHRDGAIGSHLEWVDLVDGTGRLRRLAPTGPDADLFWATVGGLGLTGVITAAAVRLRRIESAWISVSTQRCPDLAALMAGLRAHDARHRYSVAWIDVLAGGRGVITSGDHAGADAVAASGVLDVRDVRDYHPAPRLVVPQMPVGVVSTLTARAFNEVWYRKAPALREGELQRLETFFHPLDGVREWNRLYGPRGFVQYQFVVPDDRDDVVASAMDALAGARVPAFLAVLKRFGPGDAAPLSFPRPGWTLAMDVPAAGRERLARVLDGLDEEVADAGGAVYLAKDARCRPELVPVMYPRLEEWRRARDRLDPERRMASDLSRRLRLIDSNRPTDRGAAGSITGGER